MSDDTPEDGAPTAVGVPGVDPVALDAWFSDHVEGARPPLRFELITGGRSNNTNRVDDTVGHRYVLRRPPLAVDANLRLLRALSRLPLPEGISERARQYARELHQSEDLKESLRAFLERRPPVYRGR